MELKMNISFNKNEGLVMSPSNLIDLFLTGIPLCYPNGGRISDFTIRQKIQDAQKQVENFLSLKLIKQIVVENRDFTRQEFFTWGYLKTSYLINEPIYLHGTLNEVRQVTYPKEWLSVKRGTDIVQARNMYLIPNTSGGAVTTNSAFSYTGTTPHMGYFGSNFIPNYWEVSYWSGWCPHEIPADILSFIGKFAAIQILSIVGDLIYGAGIGNQSISLDGISQQYSTTKGGGKGAFAGRVTQYTDELKEEIARLKAEYLGINFRVM